MNHDIKEIYPKNTLNQKNNVVGMLNNRTFGMYDLVGHSWLDQSHNLHLTSDKELNSSVVDEMNAILKNERNFIDAIFAVDQGATNYYHFLTYVLPFIIYAKSMYPQFNNIIVNSVTGYMIEYLRLCNIKVKLIGLRGKTIACHKSIVPNSYIPKAGFENEKLLLALPQYIRLNNNVRNFNDTGKYFIERRSSNNGSELRKIMPQELLYRDLLDNGYNIICLEDLSVSQQIELFVTAKVIIAMHGAALTNMIFSPKTTRIIEVAHLSGRQICFQKLAEYGKYENYIQIKCKGFLSQEQEDWLKKKTGNFSANCLPVVYDERLKELICQNQRL